MSETKKKVTLVEGILSLITIIPLLAFQSLVMKNFYDWFVIPAFSFPPISTSLIMGLFITKAYLSKRPKSSDEHYLKILLDAMTMTLFFWGLGAIVHFWIAR